MSVRESRRDFFLLFLTFSLLVEKKHSPLFLPPIPPHDPLIKRTRLDGGRKFEDRSPGLLFAFSTLCHRHPRNNFLPQASSNYLPQPLLNHADCRPHATDKFSCRDTLNFASTSYFPSIATFFVPLELRTNIIPLIVLLPFFRSKVCQKKIGTKDF